MLNTQWLVGFGGVYGLNMLAVLEAAKALRIPVDWAFMAKVKAFETEFLRGLHNTSRCDAAQRAKCEAEFGAHLEWACRNCEMTRDMDHGGSRD